MENIVIDTGVHKPIILLRKRMMDIAIRNMPEPTVEATASSAHNKQIILAALADSTTPANEREYLQDLLRRKYS